MNPKLTLSLILIGGVVLFTVQNTEVVEIRFLLWSVAMSRALMIFLVLAVGILAGWLLHGQSGRRRPPR